MKEVASTILEVIKKYEVNEVDNNYYLQALENLQEEYPKKDYKYSRFFQKLGNKTYMYLSIENKHR